MTDEPDEVQEERPKRRRVPVRRAGPGPFDPIEYLDVAEDVAGQWDGRLWNDTPPGV